MGAKLSDGTFGSKTVFVDELDSTTGGMVNHFGADGALLYSLPASLVTPLRCGLMAALAMRYREELVLERPRKVVVIGRGELGVAICNTLWTLREEFKIGSLLSVSGRHIYKNESRLLPGIETDWPARSEGSTGACVAAAVTTLGGGGGLVVRSPDLLLLRDPLTTFWSQLIFWRGPYPLSAGGTRLPAFRTILHR